MGMYKDLFYFFCKLKWGIDEMTRVEGVQLLPHTPRASTKLKKKSGKKEHENVAIFVMIFYQ